MMPLRATVVLPCAARASSLTWFDTDWLGGGSHRCVQESSCRQDTAQLAAVAAVGCKTDVWVSARQLSHYGNHTLPLTFRSGTLLWIVLYHPPLSQLSQPNAAATSQGVSKVSRLCRELCSGLLGAAPQPAHIAPAGHPCSPWPDRALSPVSAAPQPVLPALPSQ